MDKKTIEQRVGESVLQKPKEIVIGDRTFVVSPPTTATLLLVSEQISLLPQVSIDKTRVIEGSLFLAKESYIIGDVIATLILGSKKLKEDEASNKFYIFKKKAARSDRKRELSKWLLEELSPSQLHKVFFDLIKDFQLGDFFGLTTFLIEINLLRPTKVVEKETTASGL